MRSAQFFPLILFVATGVAQEVPVKNIQICEATQPATLASRAGAWETMHEHIETAVTALEAELNEAWFDHAIELIHIDVANVIPPELIGQYSKGQNDRCIPSSLEVGHVFDMTEPYVFEVTSAQAYGDELLTIYGKDDRYAQSRLELTIDASGVVQRGQIGSTGFRPTLRHLADDQYALVITGYPRIGHDGVVAKSEHDLPPDGRSLMLELRQQINAYKNKDPGSGLKPKKHIDKEERDNTTINGNATSTIRSLVIGFNISSAGLQALTTAGQMRFLRQAFLLHQYSPWASSQSTTSILKV